MGREDIRERGEKIDSKEGERKARRHSMGNGGKIFNSPPSKKKEKKEKERKRYRKLGFIFLLIFFGQISSPTLASDQIWMR